jgi:hypothetical protein
MKTAKIDEFGGEGFSPAEETLRLIARVSVPDGLEERVQAGLRRASSGASAKARILHWPAAPRLNIAWMQNLARAAAAAAIAALVVGGGWSVSSRFQAVQPSSAVAVPAQSAGQSGFSSAGARRIPQTLSRPNAEAPAAGQPASAATKQAGKKPCHLGKSASAKTSPAQPDAPAAR